jgi:hypothetical protein
MPEKAVARVSQESSGGVNRKTLAGRATNKHVEIAFTETQSVPYATRVYGFNRPGVGNSLWVVQGKSLNGLWHAVIGVQAPVARLAESLSDAARPTKKVNCRK